MNLMDISREAQKIANEAKKDIKENNPANRLLILKLAILLGELASSTSSATNARLMYGGD